jgi:hypothetical protein
LKVEAYVVKGMTSPLILGNDFAEQFEISIIRSKGVTRLKFGDEGGAIIVQNVDGERQKVTTLISRVDTKDHRKSYRPKSSNAKAIKEGICRSLIDTEIPPNTSKRVKLLIPWKDEMQQGLIQPGGKLTLNKNLEVLDGLFLRNQDSIIVSNTSNSPINIKKGERIATLLSTSNLDEEPNDLILDSFGPLSCFIKTYNKDRSLQKSDFIKPGEELETEGGPNIIETVDMDPINKSQLLPTLDINSNLEKDKLELLHEVLLRRHKAFAVDGRIGSYSDIKYGIKLVKDAQPVSLPPYHASPDVRKVIEEHLDKWFQLDIIEQSISPWGAPVVVVFSGGRPRAVIDYRRVNLLTEPDENPLPKQSDILHSLSGSNWLTTMDANTGFHQIQMELEDKVKTAFRTHKGLFQFKRLPLGLKNGPAVFQRAMNRVLSKYLWVFSLVYIDDVVVYSKTFEDHLSHLDKVLEAIENANITLSPKKCHIAYQSLTLLGQKVSRLGITTQKEKIEAIVTLSEPKKVKELQTFLGMVNYYSNYIPYFTWIVKPLYNLLRKEQKWEWDENHQEAFNLCKEALTSAPILAYPMENMGYRLYTDASDRGVGAVLQQVQPIQLKDLKGTRIYDKLLTLKDNSEEFRQFKTYSTIKEEKIEYDRNNDLNRDFEQSTIWIERVIGYWSRLLNKAERNYSTTEREALALKEGLCKFQPKVEGENLLAITDHSALTWSQTYQTVNRRLMKWGLTFSAFPKMVIVHRAGRVHSNVDPISRLERRVPIFISPKDHKDHNIDLSKQGDINFYDKVKDALKIKPKYLEELNKQLEKVTAGNYVINDEIIALSASSPNRMETQLHISEDDLRVITEGYKKDKVFSEVLEASKTQGGTAPYIVRQDGLILFDTSRNGWLRLCIPRNLVNETVAEFHDSQYGNAHAGFDKTYKSISNSFYWPKMTKDIKEYVFKCDICQKIKHRRHLPYGRLHPIPIPERPFECVTMDLIGELPESKGFNMIYVIICKLTKYAILVPFKSTYGEKKTAQTFIDQVVCHFGLPRQIISDRDTRWRNEFWKDVCEIMGSRRALTTAYHPQADGQSEILNQTIEVAIRAYINKDKSNWVDLLPSLAFSYNNSPHTATKYSPSYLLLGFQPKVPNTFVIEGDNIPRKNLDEINSQDAVDLADNFEGMRVAAQDSLRRAQVLFEKSYNRSHQYVEFEVGDKVLVNLHSMNISESKEKGNKFERKYEGPFEITEKVSSVAYRLRIPHSYGIHPVISILHLEKYNEPNKNSSNRLLPYLRDSPQEYIILEIVDQKRVKFKRNNKLRYTTLYKCNWEGYGITEEWIPEKYLRNAPDVLKDWKSKLEKLGKLKLRQDN